MSIPDLIAEWPEVAALFDTPDLPWRPVVSSWPPPWRRMWGEKAGAYQDAGMAVVEAEGAAYEEMLELRANPRRTAGQMAGGGVARKDPVARPKMVSKVVTKAVRKAYRAAGGGLFDELRDGNERSSTYQMESQS